MKKIVIDARIINSSTGRYVERLLTYLQDIDRENEYVVLVPPKDKDYWKPTAKNFSVVTTPYENYSFGEQVGFCKQLYGLKADLVHYCMTQQPIFYTKPHVTAVLDMTLLRSYPSDKNWWAFHIKQLVGKVVYRVVGKMSKQIITISNFTKREYAEFADIPESKITTTYLAGDTLSKKPTRPKQVPENAKYIMYVGKQNDYKNIKRLMQAHQILRAKDPELQLLLVGGINKAVEMNKQWAEEKALKGIVFTGFVSDDELAWLYKHTRAYVFPSLMEGFGLPGLEAMVHSAPVASSNTTCLPEIYGDGAMYFDPLSVHDMANTIERIITDDDVRRELIEKGHKQADKYSWRKMAEQTKAVYDTVLGVGD